MKHNPCKRNYLFVPSLILSLCVTFSVSAATVTWDATPTTPGAQDGLGPWSTLAPNTNWWDGTQNLLWNNANADIAVFGINTNSATATTVTVTNRVVVGGIIFSNVGSAPYTLAATSTTSIPLATATNITLFGAAPTILQAAHNSVALGQVVELISASVVATGAVNIAASTASTNSFVRFGNITNNFLGGALSVGTPGTSSYGGTSALFLDFNTPTTTDPYASIVNDLTNLTIYSNATVRISNHNSGSPANILWPKRTTISGFGRNGINGAWAITGNVGDNFVTDLVLAGDSLIDINAGAANKVYTLYGVISGSGNLSVVSANSTANRHTLVLTNSCTFAGNVNVGGGTTLQLIAGNNRLPVNTAVALGMSGMPVATWNAYGRLVLGNASGAINQTIAGLSSDSAAPLCWVVGGNSTTASVLTINSAAANNFAGSIGGAAVADKNIGIILTGGGTLTLAGTNFANGGFTSSSGTIVFGDGITDYPLSGSITNNSSIVFNVAGSQNLAQLITGSGALSKQGGGTLTLSATNVFGGPVSVAAGLLNCTTPQTFSGGLNLAAFTELDLKRAAATVSTTASGLTLNNNTLRLDFGTKPLGPAPAVNVSGALSNTGTLTVYVSNLNPAGLGVGSYPLIKYSSFVDGGSSSFVLGTPISSQITAYVSNNVANKSVDLVISQVDYLRWSGLTDNNWDITTTNWVLSSSSASTTYTDGAFAFFDDSGNNTAINLAITPSPAAIIVTNAAKTYSFNGGNALAGAGSLAKLGSGSLTLANSFNSYSGQTLISGGTLNLGDGTTDAALSGPIEDDAALVFNVIGVNTSPAISGTGSVTKTGSGTLTLTGPNTYTGSTVINAGTVQMSDSTSLGTADNGTTLATGSELDIMTSVTTAEPLTLSGTGVSGSGALVVQSGASTWNGQMTATADTSMGAVFGASLTLGGLNAGNHIMLFQPVNTAFFTVASNLTAGAVVLDGAGGLFLNAANDTLTNIVLDKANPTSGSISATAGVNAFHSHALGTNCSVTVSNANLTGNSGAIIRLGNNVSIPTGVSLNVVIPETGDSGVGQYRATMGTLGASSTNTWNGPIAIHGGDPSSGVVTVFIIRPESSQMNLNGDVTLATGAASLAVRGSSAKAVFNGKINIGTNAFTPLADAGVTDVTLNSTGNVWGILSSAAARVRLGVANAMPASAPVQQVNASAILELNGFNQQIGGLYSSAAGTIVNSSSNTASTLTVSSATAANWIYTGTIANVAGAKALNVDVGGDELTLTAAGNNYTGSTTIRNGATLALTGSGAITATTPIDVQAGGVFDVSGTTSGGITLGAVQKLMGNGTVTGSIAVAGTVAPGASIGSLTVSGDVTNASTASMVMEVNNAAGNHDQLNVGGTLTYGGTLIVTNISGTPYTNNQVIKLFNAGTYGGSFATIIFPGVGTYDSSNLTVDGTIKVVSVVSTTPVPIIFSVTGGGSTLQLNWPVDHTGWRLQSQTNSVSAGLKTNWVTVPGSTSVNSMSFLINPANGEVFFRLVYP